MNSQLHYKILHEWDLNKDEERIDWEVFQVEMKESYDDCSFNLFETRTYSEFFWLFYCSTQRITNWHFFLSMKLGSFFESFQDLQIFLFWNPFDKKYSLGMISFEEDFLPLFVNRFFTTFHKLQSKRKTVTSDNQSDEHFPPVVNLPEIIRINSKKYFFEHYLITAEINEAKERFHHYRHFPLVWSASWYITELPVSLRDTHREEFLTVVNELMANRYDFKERRDEVDGGPFFTLYMDYTNVTNDRGESIGVYNNLSFPFPSEKLKLYYQVIGKVFESISTNRGFARGLSNRNFWKGPLLENQKNEDMKEFQDFYYNYVFAKTKMFLESFMKDFKSKYLNRFQEIQAKNIVFNQIPQLIDLIN
jgi:hypothetical protein